MAGEGPDKQDLTLVLGRAGAGDRQAAAELLERVYSQLRQSAQKFMSNERTDHTLQATALVHEAYAKLVGGQNIQWANRAHFYDAAARAMRQILIDHARAKAADKRGGTARKTPLTDIASAFHANSDDIVALDGALSRLEAEEPDLAGVVRLRFFAGLSGEETAAAMGVSPRKVDMLWARARAWLFRELESR